MLQCRTDQLNVRAPPQPTQKMGHLITILLPVDVDIIADAIIAPLESLSSWHQHVRGHFVLSKPTTKSRWRTTSVPISLVLGPNTDWLDDMTAGSFVMITMTPCAIQFTNHNVAWDADTKQINRLTVRLFICTTMALTKTRNRREKNKASWDVQEKLADSSSG